jgi:hypothetical protein
MTEEPLPANGQLLIGSYCLVTEKQPVMWAGCKPRKAQQIVDHGCSVLR